MLCFWMIMFLQSVAHTPGLRNALGVDYAAGRMTPCMPHIGFKECPFLPG